MEQRSETSAYKIQTPENYPEESIQHPYHLIASFVLNQHAVQNQTGLKKSWKEQPCIIEIGC